jgi:hypothetical protein
MCVIPIVPVRYETIKIETVNPLKAELNPICHLLALLGVHHILHVSRVRVNAQHFIIVNLKQLHVSAVQGSHHEAIYFRNVREENYIAEETVSIFIVAY